MPTKYPKTKSQVQQRLFELIKREEKLLKLQEEEIQMRTKNLKKWRVNYMWISLIIGFGVIMANTLLLEWEIMSEEPRLGLIVLDLIGMALAINLIYSSYKTRKEIKIDKQKEILRELEK